MCRVHLYMNINALISFDKIELIKLTNTEYNYFLDVEYNYNKI